MKIGFFNRLLSTLVLLGVLTLMSSCHRRPAPVAKVGDETMKQFNHAKALYENFDYAGAEKEYRAVAAECERVLGAEHPFTLWRRADLGKALRAQGKYAEAEREYRAVLAVREPKRGRGNLEVFVCCSNLAMCLEAQKKFPEALEQARRAEEGFTRVSGADDPVTKSVVKLRKLIQAEMAEMAED